MKYEEVRSITVYCNIRNNLVKYFQLKVHKCG